MSEDKDVRSMSCGEALAELDILRLCEAKQFPVLAEHQNIKNGLRADRARNAEAAAALQSIAESLRAMVIGAGNRRLSRDEWAAAALSCDSYVDDNRDPDQCAKYAYQLADAMLAASGRDTSESVDVGKVMEADYESSDVYWPNEAYADAIEIGRGYRKQRDEARAELEKLRQENVGKVMERHVKGGWNPHAEQQTQEPPDPPPPPPPPSQTLPSDGWKKLAEHNYKAAERHRDERNEARAELAAVRKERDELLRQIKSWKVQRAEWITERERWIAEGNAFRKERDDADKKLCDLVKEVELILNDSTYSFDHETETVGIGARVVSALGNAIKAAKGEA